MRRGLFIFALATLASFSFAQKEIDELESYGDPPGPVYVHKTTPGRRALGGALSVQVNVNALQQNIVGDAANEPSIWIDPTNPQHIAIGWRQFDNVTSNFRQAGNAWSDDGGNTWHNNTVFTPGTFRSDPVLGGDTNGNFYYLSLQQSFFDDMYRSQNGGQSYPNSWPADGGDKQWFTIDRTGSTGNNFQYQAWSTAGNNYGGRQFSRSTDGGMTWMNPINLPNRPVWGVLDTSPTGDLYIVGTDGSNPSLRFLRSTNAKNSAVTPTFDRSVYVDMGGDLVSGAPVNPGGLGGQAWLACDKGTGPFQGYIYILASIGGNSTNPLDVKLRRSRDGGATWDPVVRINDDATGGTKYHWFGTLAVAPDGRIDVIWNDTRESSNNSLSRLYHSHSYDGGVTWSVNRAIGPSFNQSLGYPNQNKMGDYIGLISDNLAAKMAYTATYNGEEDVYFLRYPVPFSIVVSEAFSITAGSRFSGNLASLYDTDSNALCAFDDASSLRTELVVTAHSPYALPTKLEFDLTARATRAGLVQTLEWFNYGTSAFDAMDSREATLSNQDVNIVNRMTPRAYVGSGGKMQARIATEPINDEVPAQDGWLTCVDMARWVVFE